jgi:hypothetical protein
MCGDSRGVGNSMPGCFVMGCKMEQSLWMETKEMLISVQIDANWRRTERRFLCTNLMNFRLSSLCRRSQDLGA